MLTPSETTCNSFFFISVVLCFQKLIIPEFIEFISPCSSYALSIVLIGVADGRWEDMRKFDDKIPKREFDNFQVSSHSLDHEERSSESAKEVAFALAALMEIPFQYQAATELSFLGKTTGVAKKINLRPPPTPYTPTIRTELPSPAPDEHTQNCPICLTNRLVEIADPGYQTVPSAEY
ncbi:hypothetical protein Bca4012_097561 [Brassica carinata]|uniref:Copine C-terminal domain-containing protein n=1 Tax=Brassica napus TaxID=3708 RepID=A0ABQ7YVN0_BRANA|nr:hypothetical protein HID58_069339 [Brassica napus]